MGSFKEHGVLLYLSKDLYVAFIKLQAEKGLGRAYAGLLPFTEGMYKLGFLSTEVYEAHVKKYSEGLVHPKPFTDEQIEERKNLKELEKQFSDILKQGWKTLNDTAKQYWIAKAEEYKDKVPNAKLILALRSEIHKEQEAMQ